MTEVTRIGFVGVGDLVALAPSAKAPLYHVDRISARFIHLTQVKNPSKTRSVPVQSWRSIVSVAWNDPRRDGLD